MSWRLAGALVSLRSGVNAKWPNRDKKSDGTIGDAAHASRSSDHNPWVVVGGVGVVRAIDIDVDGVDIGWLFEQLRRAGAAGDRRLAGGGYLILNRRITASDFSGWRAYTGTNVHTLHGHVSFSRARAGFDDGSPWSFLGESAKVEENKLPTTGEVWNHPVNDPSGDPPGKLTPAYGLLTYARVDADKANKAVIALTAKMDELMAKVDALSKPGT
jgi:hypothetical protein